MEFMETEKRLDATLWAAEFKRIYPVSSPDEDILVAWFANAIMVGFDEGMMRGAISERNELYVEEHPDYFGEHVTPNGWQSNDRGKMNA